MGTFTIRRRQVALAATALALTAGGIVATGVNQGAEAAGPFGPDTCLTGFVWRDAHVNDGVPDVTTDHVCVTWADRDEAAADNALRSQRVSPTGGAFGPDTCRSGFVWREAFEGDHVCVTPARRDDVRSENNLGFGRRALDVYNSGQVDGLRVGPGPTGGTITGWARLQLSPNGAYTYSGRLTNGMTIKRTVTTVCTVPLRNGKGLAFVDKRDVAGKINIFQNNTASWNHRGIGADVANEWAAIGPADPQVKPDQVGVRPACVSHDSLPVGDIINRTKQIGQIVGEVIKVFV